MKIGFKIIIFFIFSILQFCVPGALFLNQVSVFWSGNLICMGERFLNDYVLNLEKGGGEKVCLRVHQSVFEGMCMCSEKFKPITVGSVAPQGSSWGVLWGPEQKN